MILVTLGTNDKRFDRLIEKIEQLIIDGTITEEVVVQAGFTQYKSEYMKIFDLIPMEEFSKLIEKCSLLITHGGVGTIISGLQSNKKVIAIPRRKEFKEHVNDHQFQIIENFEKAGYIIASYEIDDLADAIESASSFEPKHYESNTENFLNLIKKHIDQ